MSAVHLGFYNTTGTRTKVRHQFSTHEAAGGNVAPLSAFEAADLRIYKAVDSTAFSATERTSANGITMTSPFDSLTGFHSITIDLTDNTDAGFYADGCLYSIVLAPDETIDGQTITGVVLAYFEIGLPVVEVDALTSDGEDAMENAVTAALTAADLATEAEIVAAILAGGDADGYTFEEFMILALAALTGKVSGAGTGTVVFRAADDSKDRITATVDSNGNRSAVTLDET